MNASVPAGTFINEHTWAPHECDIPIIWVTHIMGMLHYMSNSYNGHAHEWDYH